MSPDDNFLVFFHRTVRGKCPKYSMVYKSTTLKFYFTISDSSIVVRDQIFFVEYKVIFWRLADGNSQVPDKWGHSFNFGEK